MSHQQQGRRGKKKVGRQQQQKEEVVIHRLEDENPACFVCHEDITGLNEDQKIMHRGKAYHKNCYECEKGEISAAAAGLGEKFEAAKQAGARQIGAVGEGIHERYEAGKEAARQLAGETYEDYEGTIEGARRTAGHMKTEAGKKVKGAKQQVGQTVEGAKEAIGGTMQAAQTTMGNVAGEVGRRVEGVKESLGDTVHAATAKAAEYQAEAGRKIGELRSKAGEVIEGAKEHVTQAVSQTLEDGTHYVREDIPARWSHLKHHAGETMAGMKETMGTKAEDIRDVTSATLGEMGESMGETVGMLRGKGHYVKERAEENVGDKVYAMKDSFFRFKENYDNFKAEAAKGHGISLFDKAANAVSDLTAWLNGELEEEESEEEGGQLIYHGRGGMASPRGSPSPRGMRYHRRTESPSSTSPRGMRYHTIGSPSSTSPRGMRYHTTESLTTGASKN